MAVVLGLIFSNLVGFFALGDSYGPYYIFGTFIGAVIADLYLRHNESI